MMTRPNHTRFSGCTRLATATCLAMMVAVTIGGGTFVPARAQDAAGVPTCAVEATPSIDEVLAVAATPSAPQVAAPNQGPVTEDSLPHGAPADPPAAATADGVVRMWVACILDGSELSILALQSDRMDRLFYSEHAQDLEWFRVVLSEDAASTPVPVDRQIDLSPGRDVRVLDDGRIGGIWSIGGDAAFVILVSDGDRWLVDEVIDLAE